MSALHQVLLMAGVVQSDPYWAYVKTLLHFDGDLTDSSTSALTYVANASAAVSAGAAKFGTTGLDCTATDNDWVACGAAALMAGTADLCIEGWFYDPFGRPTNVFLYEGSSSQTIRLYTPGALQLSVDVSGGGHAGTVAFALNTWYHVAVTRSGNNWTFWLDGVAVKTWTNATYNGGPNPANLYIGGGSAANSGRRAFNDEWRLTVGVPRYTIPFTPAGPFPNY